MSTHHKKDCSPELIELKPSARKVGVIKAPSRPFLFPCRKFEVSDVCRNLYERREKLDNARPHPDLLPRGEGETSGVYGQIMARRFGLPPKAKMISTEAGFRRRRGVLWVEWRDFENIAELEEPGEPEAR